MTLTEREKSLLVQSLYQSIAQWEESRESARDIAHAETNQQLVDQFQSQVDLGRGLIDKLEE